MSTLLSVTIVIKINTIFKNSRHGAEVLEKGTSSSTKGNQTFKGTGYRLGQSEEDTQGSTFLGLESLFFFNSIINFFF